MAEPFLSFISCILSRIIESSDHKMCARLQTLFLFFSLQTRLHESIELFESVRNDRSLSSIPFFLFLNKQDKLKKKLEEGKKLEEYFPDFASYSAPNISGTLFLLSFFFLFSFCGTTIGDICCWFVYSS